MAARKKKMSDQERLTLEQLLKGDGFDNTTSNSYAMPFIRILQKMSPEVDKDESAYIKGAKAGMILLTSTQDAYEEINIVVLDYVESYIEWIPREKGGGFVQEVNALDPMAKEILASCEKVENQNILPNGNEFKLHANYQCAIEVEEDEWEPATLSMSASQLKTSRIWLRTLRTMKMEIEGQSYSNINIRSFQWTLGTEKLSNDKGNWFGWTYDKTDNTMLLPDLGVMQASIIEAQRHNLLTYDRGQQDGGGATIDNESGNAL